MAFIASDGINSISVKFVKVTFTSTFKRCEFKLFHCKDCTDIHVIHPIGFKVTLFFEILLLLI